MKYHNSLHKLPLSIFLDCYCDGNLQALIIEGEVDDYVLTDTWMNLQEEYVNALGNSEQRLFLKLLKEVNVLVATLNQIKILLPTLRLYYAVQLAKKLNKLLLIETNYMPTDWVAYNKQLDAAENKIAGVEMQMELKQHALEELTKKMNKVQGEKPTRSYFARLMNAMEEHFQIQVNEDITMTRFCDRIKRMSKPKNKR